MNVVSCNENGINKIIKSYENGEIIGFPTDTVYGAIETFVSFLEGKQKGALAVGLSLIHI